MVYVDERDANEFAAKMKTGVQGGEPKADAWVLHEVRKKLTNRP